MIGSMIFLTLSLMGFQETPTLVLPAQANESGLDLTLSLSQKASLGDAPWYLGVIRESKQREFALKEVHLKGSSSGWVLKEISLEKNLFQLHCTDPSVKEGPTIRAVIHYEGRDIFPSWENWLQRVDITLPPWVKVGPPSLVAFSPRQTLAILTLLGIGLGCLLLILVRKPGKPHMETPWVDLENWLVNQSSEDSTSQWQTLNNLLLAGLRQNPEHLPLKKLIKDLEQDRYSGKEVNLDLLRQFLTDHKAKNNA